MGLAPGSHTVEVTDSNLCHVSGSTSPIVEPRAIEIALTSSAGSIEVLANYGTGLYEYSFDGTNWGIDPHLDPGPGDDAIYVRDRRGCVASHSLGGIFADGFESGNTSAWSASSP